MDQKNNNEKHGFLLFPLLKKTFDILDVHLVSFKNLQLSTPKLCHWFIGVGKLFKTI
jgi:hypothetical protein